MKIITFDSFSKLDLIVRQAIVNQIKIMSRVDPQMVLLPLTERIRLAYAKLVDCSG